MPPRPSNLPEPMTLAELLALPPVMDLEAAAHGLRLTYTNACKLRRERKFPLSPLPHSGRYPLYALADLLRYLGFDPAMAVTPAAPGMAPAPASQVTAA